MSAQRWVIYRDEPYESLNPDQAALKALLSTMEDWAEEFGIERDWPDNLHPVDVLEKHIFREIRAMLHEQKLNTPKCNCGNAWDQCFCPVHGHTKDMSVTADNTNSR